MARKSEQIASLFAAVGFKVDNASLKRLESSLAGVEKRLNNIVKGFKSVGTGSLTSALRTTAKDSGKAAVGISEVTAKLKSGIPAITVYTQQMRALAGALREVSGASPRRLPTIPNTSRAGGSSSPASSPPRSGGLFGRMGGVGSFARGLLPGLGSAYALMNVVGTGRNIIGNENAMAAITGSQASGKAEMEYVKGFSKKWSLDYGAQAESYKGILAAAQGSGMQGQGARTIFEGASLYGAALQIDPEKMKRGMTALTQMLSKGKVMSEELKGQLAEALPGAVQSFAKSLKTTVPEMYKMMEAGQVTSDKLEELGRILKEQASQGGALEIYKRSSLAAQTDLKNTWTDFSTSLMKNGLDQALAFLFNSITKILKTLMRFGGMVKDALGVVPSIVWKLVAAFAAFKLVAMAIPFAKILWSFLMLQKAINPTWYRKPLLLVFLLLLLAVLEDIAYWQAGKGSLIGDIFGAWPEFVNAMEPFFKRFEEWRDTIADALGMLKNFLVKIRVIAPDPEELPPGSRIEHVKKPSLSSGAASFYQDTPKVIRNLPFIGPSATLAVGATMQAWENYRTPDIKYTGKSWTPKWSPDGGFTVNQYITGADPTQVSNEATRKIAQLLNLGGATPQDSR